MTASIRQILGPCRCQGCDQSVVLERRGHELLGWLHVDGEYRCPGWYTRKRYRTKEEAQAARRRSNREYMRRARQKAASALRG